jgi:hypothetical protein
MDFSLYPINGFADTVDVRGLPPEIVHAFRFSEICIYDV